MIDTSNLTPLCDNTRELLFRELIEQISTALCRYLDISPADDDTITRIIANAVNDAE